MRVPMPFWVVNARSAAKPRLGQFGTANNDAPIAFTAMHPYEKIRAAAQRNLCETLAQVAEQRIFNP
jgi:hypothetical protein